MKILSALLVLALSLGCARNPPTPATAGSSEASTASAADDDIREAVFRYQFEHNASGLQKSAERYCLSVEGDRMPSADFLRRFAGHTPPVTSADQCDRTTGRDLFFLVKDIQRQGENEVWVRGGYWEGNLSSSGELYIVGRENGKWVVKESRMEMIS
ncbi:MAG TPA: hypothetical protein VF756_12090 [Thermoanaerobaculia bacterium]